MSSQLLPLSGDLSGADDEHADEITSVGDTKTKQKGFEQKHRVAVDGTKNVRFPQTEE